MFWFFDREACVILAEPDQVIEPAAPALEGEVLTAREVPDRLNLLKNVLIIFSTCLVNCSSWSLLSDFF